MTDAQARMVEAYFDAGYIVLIGGTGYVDSPVTGVYDDDVNGIVYDSETFSSRPLSEVYISDVAIAMPLYSVETGVVIDEVGDNYGYEIKVVDGEEV